MATHWTALTEEMQESRRSSFPSHKTELLYDLGQILESLWIFYEARRRGAPVLDADMVLSRMGIAFRRVSHRQSGRVDNGSVECG